MQGPQQPLISERVAESIALRNKVDGILTQDKRIDELLRSITLGRTDGHAKVDATLAGLKEIGNPMPLSLKSPTILGSI